jgi:hypothetical protein
MGGFHKASGWIKEFEFVIADDQPLGRSIDRILMQLMPHRSSIEEFVSSGGRVDLQVDFLIRTGAPTAVLDHGITAKLGQLGIDMRIEMVVDRDSWIA